LASAIVSLQAQYGFDARPGAQPNPQVNFWSDTLIDADANGVVGDAGDLQRVLAVRIALVARSAVLANEVCDANAPEWLAGNPVTGQLETQAIDVSFVPNWRCYRFRVLQDEIPLRNLIWNDA
jgi:type IV pilus assembly protein PilW